jgi:hypothetical protein
VIGVVTAWHAKPLLESLNNGFITAIDKALRHTAHIVWMSIDNEGVLYTGELGRLLTGLMAQEPRVLSPNGKLTSTLAGKPRANQPFQISRPELGGSASSADVSHYLEWIRACHGGPAASANYEFEAPIAESLMLGNIAIRTQEALEWDTTSFHFKRGSQRAQALLMPSYRPPWSAS